MKKGVIRKSKTNIKKPGLKPKPGADIVVNGSEIGQEIV